MVLTSGLIGNFGQANYSAAKMGVVALSKSIAMDMAKFNVRSNCISPFAWSRMIGSMHASDDWTPTAIAQRAMPATRRNFYKLDRSQDVLDWDPV